MQENGQLIKFNRNYKEHMDKLLVWVICHRQKLNINFILSKTMGQTEPWDNTEVNVRILIHILIKCWNMDCENAFPYIKIL